jgi:hypothetical protein
MAEAVYGQVEDSGKSNDGQLIIVKVDTEGKLLLSDTTINALAAAIATELA